MDGAHKMISIVLPSLNSIEYISDCLDSIVKQTLQPLELICVDAESEDGTIDILKKYENAYGWIHIITSHVRSYGYQLNLGIDHAKGKYLMVVESDDILPKDACKILFNAITRYGADFVRGSMMDFLHYNGKNVGYVRSYYYSDEETDRLINLIEDPVCRRINSLCIQASIYDMDFIKKCGIKLHDSEGASYQDTGFCLQVSSLAKTCAFVNDVVYYRRRGNEGSSYFVGDNYIKIIDEYKWLVKKLSIADNEIIIHNLILYTKLYSYYWMLARIREELRPAFISSIQRELDYYDVLGGELNDNEELMLSELRGKTEFSEAIERKYNNIEQIIRWINYGSIVVFGIGRLGKKFVENLKCVQSIFNKSIIEAICDNNKDLIGTKIYDNEIISVETAVKDFIDSQYIVVNKKETEDMKKQLLNLGIREDHIFLISSMDIFDFEREIIGC